MSKIIPPPPSRMDTVAAIVAAIEPYVLADGKVDQYRLMDVLSLAGRHVLPECRLDVSVSALKISHRRSS